MNDITTRAQEMTAALCAALEVAEAERDALRADRLRHMREFDALRAEVKRLMARKAEMCGCVNYAEPVANYTQDGCPKCGGSGAVIVEGQK